MALQIPDQDRIQNITPLPEDFDPTDPTLLNADWVMRMFDKIVNGNYQTKPFYVVDSFEDLPQDAEQGQTAYVSDISYSNSFFIYNGETWEEKGTDTAIIAGLCNTQLQVSQLETYTIAGLCNLEITKQDVLTAGENISISNNNVISADVPAGNNLYDIKVLSQAITDKGFACLCKSARQDLSINDVPTVYNDILEKYNSTDTTQSDFTNKQNMTSAVGNISYKVAMYHNNYYYLFLPSENVIKKTASITDDTIAWTDINVNQSCQTAFDTGKFALFLVADGSGIMLFNYDTEEQKILNYNTNCYDANTTENYKYNFKVVNDTVYLINKIDKKIIYFPNDYNISVSDIKEIDLTDFQYGFVSDLCYNTDNNLFYFVSVNLDDNKLYIHNATDITNKQTYNLNINNRATPSYTGINSTIVNAFVYFINGYFITLEKYNNGATNLYNDGALARSNFYKWSSDFLTDTNHFTANNDTVGSFTYQQMPAVLNNKIALVGWATVATTQRLVIWLVNTDTFSFEVMRWESFPGSVQNQGNALITNNGVYWITRYYTCYIAYEKTQYTDTYTINDNTITINYYKFGSWKICIPNTTNDNNLDTFYNYYGYLPYWRIDVSNQTVSLMRDSRLWTMMYVGDDFIDSNLPDGQYERSAMLDDIQNGTMYLQVNGTTQGLFSANQSMDTTINVSALSAPTEVAVDTATVSLDIVPNTEYKCSTAVTSLTLNSMSVSALESNIYFTTGTSIAFTDNILISNWVNVEGSPALETNTQYIISIKNGKGVIGTVNA